MGKKRQRTRKTIMLGIVSTTAMGIAFSLQPVGAATTASALQVRSSLIPPAQPLVEKASDTYNFSAAPSTTKIAGGTWQQLGTGSALVPSQGKTRAESGRVSSIAISETNGSETIYLGSAQGGVWSSSDNGASWKPRTDNQASLSTGSVAVDPNNPNVIYVGTGEQHLAADSRFGKGVLKSTDGGTTWTLLGSDVFGGQHIGKITVDPHDSSSVWVAADRGVFHSSDGGTTWRQSLGFRFGPGNRTISAIDVHVDAQNPNIVYANFTYYGIYKSVDGGATWTWTSRALPSWMRGYHSCSMAVVEGTTDASDKIYASATSTSGELMGMYVSSDGGTTWTQLDNVPQYFDENFSYTGVFDENNATGQGPYDNTIAVDPTDPFHILAGGITLIESHDGGQTWSVLDTFLDSSHAPIADIHPDQHTITFDSKGNAFVGNDGGIYEETKSGTWRDLNSASLATTMYSSGMTASDKGSKVLGGTQGTGTLLFDSTSGTWNQVYGNDGGYTYIDPKRTNSMFAESQFGNIGHTTDGGSTWTPWMPSYVDSTGNSVVAFTAPFTVRPSAKEKYEVLVGSECVSRMSDDGTVFTRISKDFTMGPYADPVVALSQSQKDPNVVYAGTVYGQIYACFNAEAQFPLWANITPFVSDATNAPDPRATVSSIAINPANDKEITVTYGNSGQGYFMPTPGQNNHVYWCSNTTAASPSWTNVSGNLPFAYVDSAVYLGSNVLVGTDQGVYAGLPGGSNWIELGTGLPNVPVTSIVPLGGGQIAVGTYGRGVFNFDVPKDLSKLF